MKNRKIRTSGEVTITRQKSTPQTGPNAQSVVMQWPEAARMPVPMVSVTQNVAAIPRRCRRRSIRTPPPMITMYAAIIQAFNGDHQKSSGSTRVLPRSTNAPTNPMLDGLKMCEPLYLMTYFVRSERPATPAKTYQPSVVQWSPGAVPTRRISATPLPVSIALAGQTNARDWRKVSAISMAAQVRMAARICGMLTPNPSPSWPKA